MVQYIPRGETTAEKFMKAFSGGLGGAARGLERIGAEREAKQKEAEQQAVLEQLLGQEAGSLKGLRDPKMMQELLAGNIERENLATKYGFEKELLQGKIAGESQKKDQERLEKATPYISGLQTIARMRELGKKGHLGPKLSQGLGVGFFSPEVRQDRAEYEQLGKSLISLASTIPIRNQREFETLSNNLYDPSLTDSTREGILNAMERIITQSLESLGKDMSATEDFSPISKKTPQRKLEDIFK